MSHTCQTPECGKPATLQCPTCITLGVEGSFFCSQDCFKKGFASHKRIHKKAKTAANTPDFRFAWTGQLRPGHVTPGLKPVPPHIPRPDYAETGIPISEETASVAVEVKNPEQIAGMRHACRMAREIIDEAGRAIKPGVTGEQLDEIVHNASIARNGYPSPLNYRGFPKSVCVSPNEVVCHGIPDLRPLADGDIVNLDVTVYINGFHGDCNETYFVGNVDDASRHLVEVTYQCLDLAIKSVKPGIAYRSIGDVITAHARKNGLSVVRTYCGHGIGNLFHTTPTVPHYAKNKAIGIAAPGHTFTIEPMINLGRYNEDRWPDDWTSVTEDGTRSAQFEHTLLVTETGVEVLTARLPGGDYSAPQFYRP